MNMPPIALGLFAQAADVAAAAPAAAAPAAAAMAAAWWREPWALWGLALLTIAGPTLLAWLLAKSLRASDMWGRLAAVLVAAAAGGVICWLGWPPRLGIDLKGGVILVYEVDQAKQREKDADGAAAGPVDMDKLVAAVSRRVNPGGQKEVTVRRFGLDQLEVIVPEVDQAEVDLIKKTVSSAGVLEFRITANSEDARHRRAIELAGRSAGETVSDGGKPVARWVQLDTAKMDPAENRGLVIRTSSDGRAEALVILDNMNVTGGSLARASSSYDSNMAPCVNFAFKPDGAVRFQVLTSQNLPDQANGQYSRLGILLDSTLLSAPRINDVISANGQITGNFQQSDVDWLVGVLNAGSLPAALVSEPISEQKISPQLGADTIASGARAMLLATIVVLAFMLAYYRFSGFVADLAVLLNILLVLALMISIKAAFTLAGLAGLVLSVGMAVDANVLIYERMREEMDRGAAVRMAIRNGFSRAFSTIVDSNLTTLITGFVLYFIGTDQLKGFAVTLILGLTLNLFTAVFCSRVIFDLAERNRWITKLSMARLFGQTNFRFVAWIRPAILFSLCFVLAGLAAAWLRGQGLFDIDFTGGTSVQVAFKPDQPLDIAAVRKAVSALPDVAVSAVTAGDALPGTRYKIDTSMRDETPDDGNDVEKTLREVFPGRLLTYSMGFGEVTSTAKAGEKPDPAALTTVAPLDFPEKINRVTLQATLRDAFAAAGFPDAAFELEAEGTASRTRPERNWAVSTALEPAQLRTVLEQVATKLAGTPVYLSANAIGGKVAGNTKLTAVYALLASLVMIVLYVWVRFQNVAFGLAAVVALAHDVLVAVACLALSKFVAPFMGWALVDDFKISLDVVAALLTIIGFSINDTIVIFDRIRELRGKSQFVTADMVDRAVNQTLSRTILTSGTALLATLILYLFGGQGIHAFAFTMLVGIITGSYSTIYIAAPIVLWLQHRFGGAAERSVRPSGAAQPA